MLMSKKMKQAEKKKDAEVENMEIDFVSILVGDAMEDFREK